jgi:hypothetical protein
METAALVERTWRGLVGVHRAIEATSWGGLLLGNVWPAYLFALPLGVRLWGFLLRLTRPPADPSVHAVALQVQEFVTIAFLLLIVALFAVRRPVVGRRAGWRGGLVALAGTFLLNVVGFLPVEASASTTAVLASARSSCSARCSPSGAWRPSVGASGCCPRYAGSSNGDLTAGCVTRCIWVS